MTTQIDTAVPLEIMAKIRCGTARILLSAFFGLLIKEHFAGFTLMPSQKRFFLVTHDQREAEITALQPTMYDDIMTILKMEVGLSGPISGQLVQNIHVIVGEMIYTFQIQFDETANGDAVFVSPAQIL